MWLSLYAATIQDGSVAKIVAENIHQEFLEYQDKLPDNESDTT